jgi:hypothetical protein
MTALVGGEVEATFSKSARWLTGHTIALSQPNQSAREERADPAEMGRCVSRFGRLPKWDMAVPHRWVVELKHPALL